MAYDYDPDYDDYGDDPGYFDPNDFDDEDEEESEEEARLRREGQIMDQQMEDAIWPWLADDSFGDNY